MRNIKVQQAKLATVFPRGGNWIYEMKYDGWRIVAFIEFNNATNNSTMHFISRNGNDFTEQFKTIAKVLQHHSNDRNVILDGEMIVTDEQGNSDFHALRSPVQNKLSYIVFDILTLDGQDLRNKPLSERKEILKNFLKDCPSNIHLCQFTKGKGREIFKQVCELGLEGIIAKDLDSTYAGNRNGTWLKFKCENYVRK